MNELCISESTIDNQELHSNKRIDTFSLDEYYIRYFIEAPTNKTKAYRKARSKLGISDTNNDTFYAYKLHLRLAERIQVELLANQLDNRAIGQAKLRYLADNASSESVQANVSTTLFNDGRDRHEEQGITVNVNRDNVTISHKNQSLTITPDKDTE